MVDLQALVNASRSATRVHQTRTLTDGYAIIKVLVGSAFPATPLWVASGIEVAKRIIMSTKPTQPLSQDTAVSVIESPPRESLHCADSFDCPTARRQVI